MFDQVRHPMRFAVAASTVSGLIVTLLTAASQTAFRSAVSGRSFVLWTLAVTCWALTASSLMLWGRSRETRSTDTTCARDTVVAGVDGTPQARALIEAGPGPLRATVVQDSYKVAETAVRLLERMIRKETVPARTALAAEIVARD